MMGQIFRSFIVFLGLLWGFSSCSSKITSGIGSDTENTESASIAGANIRDLLQNSFDTLTVANYIKDQNSQDQLFKELKRFYRFSNYNLRWCNDKGTTEEARELLNTLSLANEHGLNPKSYNVDGLVDLIDSVYTYNFNARASDIARLDISLTASYLTYSWHLYNGMVNPEQLQSGWHKANQNTEIAQYLAGKTLQQSLEMIEPEGDNYRKLQRKLETYISIANEGGWPTLPDTINLKPGDYDEAVYDLRDRLSYSGYLRSSLSGGRGGAVYDDKLADAVKAFQKGHGLNANGIVNKETIEALNVSVDYRVAQIKMNLERLRWMPREMDQKYLLVNVPEFKLKIYRKNKIDDEMRVIVGRLNNMTPMINSKIEYLIMSPTWAVPNQIFNKNVLPLVKQDPDYLEKSGYKLYASADGIHETLIDAHSLKWKDINVIEKTYKVIHTPAPSDDKKGGIKFVVPNAENLYLCDAPTPALFDFSYRTFNYTSISVEEPKKLARYIIDEKRWDLEAIEQNMVLDEPVKVVLKNQIPIYVTYMTSIIDGNGNIIFCKDIYDYDAKQAKLMGIEMVDDGFKDNPFSK